MGKTALIAVDVQPDFINGSLGGEGRDKVIEPLVQLADQADVVIATRDWHPEDHMSFSDDPQFKDKSWPKHCIQGTPGAEIVPEIAEKADYIISKGTDSDTEQYSGWMGATDDGRGLGDILEAEGVDKVIVGGLCTDYCVKNTAIDLSDWGNHRVVVYTQAIAGVDPNTSEDALAEMGQYGVKFIKRHPATPASRKEIIDDVVEEIAELAEDAEHGNQHILSSWYGSLCGWVRERARQGDAFTVTAPDSPDYDAGVKVFEIPAKETAEVH